MQTNINTDTNLNVSTNTGIDTYVSIDVNIKSDMSITRHGHVNMNIAINTNMNINVDIEYMYVISMPVLPHTLPLATQCTSKYLRHTAKLHRDYSGPSTTLAKKPADLLTRSRRGVCRWESYG